MIFLIRTLILSYITAGFACSQPFLFADTHPVNNPNSLKQWLLANPAASSNRLKNLITLERIYSWGYHDKVGNHLPAIGRLARAQRNPVAEATYLYIQDCIYFNQNDNTKTALYTNKALQQFQQLNDLSGELHAYGLLVLITSSVYGNQVLSDSTLS